MLLPGKKNIRQSLVFNGKRQSIIFNLIFGDLLNWKNNSQRNKHIKNRLLLKYILSRIVPNCDMLILLATFSTVSFFLKLLFTEDWYMTF